MLCHEVSKEKNGINRLMSDNQKGSSITLSDNWIKRDSEGHVQPSMSLSAAILSALPTKLSISCLQID